MNRSATDNRLNSSWIRGLALLGLLGLPAIWLGSLADMAAAWGTNRFYTSECLAYSAASIPVPRQAAA